jgi:hypothetical protein
MYNKTSLCISSHYWKLSFVLEICRFIIFLTSFACHISLDFVCPLTGLFPHCTSWNFSLLYELMCSHVTSVEVTYFCIVCGLNKSSERWWHKFGQRLSDVTLQVGQQFTNTVRPRVHVPAFCVFCKFTYILYGPSQMPIRTMFLRFETFWILCCFSWSPQKCEIGVLLYV